MKISVRVRTKASKCELVKEADGSYKAYLTASPVKGAANRQLIGLVSEEFGVAKTFIVIVKGVSSREKVLKIGK